MRNSCIFKKKLIQMKVKINLQHKAKMGSVINIKCSFATLQVKIKTIFCLHVL